MPRRCAFGCEQNNETMHSFPNPKRLRKMFDLWVSMVEGCEEGPSCNEEEYRNKRICDKHFENEYKNRNKRLNALAVPTLHLPRPLSATIGHKDHCYSKETPKATAESAKEGTSNADLKPPVIDLPLPPNPRSYSHLNVPLDLPLLDPSSNDGQREHAKDEEIEYTDVASPAFTEPEERDTDPQLPEATIQEEIKPKPSFSWEREIDLVPTDDQEEVTCVELSQSPIDIYRDDEPKVTQSDNRSESEKHGEYQCNKCHKDIVGFRYTCVQCADWDLCGACEARAAHGAHYMLRVPRARPYYEVQSMLAAIRQQLLSENLFLDDKILASIKIEPKDESDSENTRPVGKNPDPLEEWMEEYLSETSVASDAGSSPSRKRRRSSEHENQPKTAHKQPNIPQTGSQNQLQSDTLSHVVSNTCKNPVSAITQPGKTPSIPKKSENTPQTGKPQPVIHPMRTRNTPDSEHKSTTEKRVQNLPRKDVTPPTMLPTSINKSQTDLSKYIVQNPSMLRHLPPHRRFSKIKCRRIVKQPCVDPRKQSDSPKVPPERKQSDSLIVSEKVPEPRIFDDRKNSPSGFQHSCFDKKIVKLGKVGPLKKMLDTNLIGSVNRQTVLLKIPAGSSALDISKALQSKASVRIEPLKMETIRSLTKKKRK